ncbi:MAG: hypothetical protein JSS02_35365 [Planctomycetes bacterium]|nr:hypothetical protein [Planctomycetota bacterium]
MPKFAPRIHILLARQASVGLVIRRGPSKQVATFLWDRRRDTFELGQWLKGRIYERRCDLSPDGKYFLYFAMNGKWKSESQGSWSAISKAPWLKALAFFPKGDCWHGGGLWTGKKSYWLNDDGMHQTRQETTLVQRDLKFSLTENFGGECPGVYYPRLLRDGWTLIERNQLARWSRVDIFEKPLPNGWTLRKRAHAELDHPPGKGCYWDEHELTGPKAGQSLPCPTWEWADLDGRRLVWAAGGKLFAAQLQRTGLADTQELFDFNDWQFSAIAAPY